MATPTAQTADFTLEKFETGHVPAEVFAGVKRLFSENYREANEAYLERNLGKLRYLSVARASDGRFAGFALGELRVLDLPRAPQTNVSLAGLCCVGAEFRRHGLFGKLESLAIGRGAPDENNRYLSAGRTAHPASFRNFFRNPNAVPHPGRRPTEWQQQVGSAVAKAYGSPGFDPETFVVKGSGVPIGWPIIEIEATPEEWAMFEHVDRANGDSLLGIAWAPTPPEGWLDP